MTENLGTKIGDIYSLVEESPEKISLVMEDPEQYMLESICQYLLDMKKIKKSISYEGILEKESLVLCLPTIHGHQYILNKAPEGINVLYLLGDEGKIKKCDPSEKKVIVGKIKHMTRCENTAELLKKYDIKDKNTEIVLVEAEEVTALPYLG